MWSEHTGAFWGLSWSRWDDLVRSLAVQSHWEEGSDGPGAGAIPVQPGSRSRPLQEQQSASASSPLAGHRAGPVGAEGVHDAGLARVILPEGRASRMEVAVGVSPSPPAVDLPAPSNEPGSGSGASAPQGEPRRPKKPPPRLLPGLPPGFPIRPSGLPAVMPPPAWEGRAAPGPPPWDPPAAPGPPPPRPPAWRVRQEAPPPQPREQEERARRRARSQEASHLLPARERSSSGSYERSRPASTARRERSRGRSAGHRRAATVPIASERGSSGRRAGRPFPAEAPPRGAGAHPPSVPGAGRLETEISVLRHSRAEDLPLLLPPFLRTLSTQQLGSTVVLVMEEWIRREGR